MNRQLTVIIEREGDGYVSFCPDIDVASQGAMVQEASVNVRDAVELFFEVASPDEVGRLLHNEIYSASWPDTPKRTT
jgi:predicted RNase H-like HicB family nuclease